MKTSEKWLAFAAVAGVAAWFVQTQTDEPVWSSTPLPAGMPPPPDRLPFDAPSWWLAEAPWPPASFPEEEEEDIHALGERKSLSPCVCTVWVYTTEDKRYAFIGVSSKRDPDSPYLRLMGLPLKVPFNPRWLYPSKIGERRFLVRQCRGWCGELGNHPIIIDQW